MTISNATASDATASSTTAPKPVQPDPLTDKSVFLQLLIAQLKNQNPLNPADGVEFVSQLAQFSSLEQTNQIRDDLDNIRQLLANQAKTTNGQAQT